MNDPREITESFRLERVLKSSRSAIVFQAVDPATAKVVAIKLIPPAAPESILAAQSRFLGAMEAVATLSPPGFPPLLDCGFTPDGSAFMVMEFVHGKRLDALPRRSPEQVLRLVAEVAGNLEKLANRRVAHGNLRPDNLLAVPADGEEHVAILGFGTAAFQAAPGGGDEGGPSFAAPERQEPATAAAEPDWRSDVYSLARTVCALLGAEVSLTDAATPSVSLPAEVRQRLRDSVVLRAILEQALRRSPEARPASPEEFRQAIEFAIEGVPGHEALVPEVEGAAVIAAAEALSAPARVAGSERDDSLAPPRELIAPAPVARRDEIPAGAPPLEALLAEIEEPPEAVEAPPPAPGQQPEVEPAPEGAITQPVVAPASSRRKPRSRFQLALGVAVAAIGLAAAAAVLVVLSRRPSPSPRQAAAPTLAPKKPTALPQPTSQPLAVTRLQQAEAAVALSDLVAARQALDSITQAQIETLSAAERDRYASLRAAYDAKVAQTLTRAIATSLASGNLKALAETVRGISKEDEAGFARNEDLLAALEEARRALNVQALMLKAQRQGDWPEVLQQAGVLTSLVPRNAQAVDLRERAAATLEREADALAAKGNYEVALARLESVRRSWSGRSGLTARIERIKADQATDAQLLSVVVAAEQTEKDKVPEKGLALLAGVSAPPRWQERLRQLHDRLSAQLLQLDASPPTVALASGGKLEYKKNEPGTIALRISDDHGIKSAKLFARLEGTEQYVELPLRPGGAGEYVGEVSPGFHKNTTVEFYVVASDFSDHTSQLGSAQEPLKLKRKKWSLFGR